MGDRRFIKTLLIGVLLAVGSLFAAIWAAGWITDYAYRSQQVWIQYDWVAIMLRIFASLLAVWIGFLLFVPVSALFIGFFLDDIVDAVEERYYPDNRGGPHLGFLTSLWLGAKFAAVVIVVNILLLPIYVLTFWVPFVPMAVFWVVNAYLLAWGLHDLIAPRHMSPVDARAHRRRLRVELLFVGLIVAALFTIPIINIAAPVIGAAMMVHIFHARA